MDPSAKALTELRDELEALRAANARLAARLDALDGQRQDEPHEPRSVPEYRPASGDADGDEPASGLSRRGLLKRLAGAGALGAGVVVVGNTFAPRAARAAAGDNMVLGASNDAGATTTSLTATTAPVLHVITRQPSLVKVNGTIVGEGDGPGLAGVAGLGSDAHHYPIGVLGVAIQPSGVQTPTEALRSQAPPPGGVVGDTGASHYAVAGTNSVGAGVYGCAFGSADAGGGAPIAAVVGDTNSADNPAVLGRNSAGVAMLGVITTSSDGHSAIAGQTAGPGQGVRGFSTNSAGRGGVFQGGNTGAPVQMVPATVGTHPTSGRAGDFFVDSGGRLWFCTHGGSTATWKQLA